MVTPKLSPKVYMSHISSQKIGIPPAALEEYVQSAFFLSIIIRVVQAGKGNFRNRLKTLKMTIHSLKMTFFSGFRLTFRLILIILF